MATISKIIERFKVKVRTLLLLSVILIAFLGNLKQAYADYEVSEAAYSWCQTTYASTYQLMNFSITETAITGNLGFTISQTNLYFDLLLPSGFTFQNSGGTATVTSNGTEVTINSFSFTSTTRLRVYVTTSATNLEYNTIYFNNVGIRATATNRSGYLRRSGGTFKFDNATTNPTAVQPFVVLSSATLFNYTSSATQQTSVKNLKQYTANNDILRIAVVGTGTCNSTITRFIINTDAGDGTGTQRLTNIDKIKIYYTGTSAVFATTTLFGGTVDSLTSNLNNIDGSMNLLSGTNYFWVTYDIRGDAYCGVDGNKISCKLESFLLNGVSKTPTRAAMTGDRVIANAFYYTLASGDNDTYIYSTTDGGANCTCQPNGAGVMVVTSGTDINLHKDLIVDAVEIRTGASLIPNGLTKALTVNGQLVMSGSSYFEMGGTLTVNGSTYLYDNSASHISQICNINGDILIDPAATLMSDAVANDINIKGNAVIDGVVEQIANRKVYFDGLGTQAITGNGTVSGAQVVLKNGNKTISTGTNLTIEAETNCLISGKVTVTNNGNVYMNTVLDGDSITSTWVNAANSRLNYGGANYIFPTAGILNAGATNNTVNYSLTTPNIFSIQYITAPILNQYWNLEIGTVTDTLAYKLLYQDLSIKGNFTNKCVFIPAGSNVTFNGTALQTITSAGSTFYSVTLANTTVPYALQIADDMIINGTYSQNTNGLFYIGSNNLTFGLNAINNITSPSSSRMIVADPAIGTGQVKKIFKNAASSFVFPIGDNSTTAEYSPITLSFTTNTVQRTIGVNVTDVTPSLPAPAPTAYISRYWNFTDDNADLTYNYTIDMNYLTADITGTESNLTAHISSAANWLAPLGTLATSTNHFLVTPAVNGASFPLNNNKYTLFSCVSPAVYAITGGGSFSNCIGTVVGLANSQIGVNYQLQLNGVNTGSQVAGTDAAISFGSQTGVGTHTAIAYNAASGCSSNMSGTAVVTSGSMPTDNTGGNKFLCIGYSTVIGTSSVSGHTYSWSPATGLSSTTVSNPTANPTVTTTYTLTETITSTGCTASYPCVVTIDAPTVSIAINYCGHGGKIQLSSDEFSSYLWSTGATTQSILVDLAGTYSLTATNANGCKAYASTEAKKEYVTNGDFSSGNTGFTTSYGYTTSKPSGLWPENLYAVDINAHDFHSNFYGTDHTSPGTGKCMIINGATAATPITVWQENITINPNTVYYFAAYAMSVNQAGNYAQLWFAINGTQVGATLQLTAGANSTAGPFVWTRFYGTWFSGSSTTAVLSIKDMQTAASGNDFAIDDISCSDISFVDMTTTPTAAATCDGSDLNLLANRAGGSSPFLYNWTGPDSFTASSENPSVLDATLASSGTYNVSIEDFHGCIATGSVAVNINPRPTSVISGTTTICNGSSTNLSVALTGTKPWSITYTDGTTPVTISGINTSPKVISVSPTTSKTYTITALNDSKCTAIEADMTGSATITVNIPSTAPTSISGTTPICNGSSISLTAVGGTEGTGSSYQWGTGAVVGSNIIIGQTTISITVSPSATTTYWVRRTGPAPCSLTTAGVTFTVTVNARPTSVISGTTNLCNGSSTNLSVALTGAQPWSITYTDGTTPVTISDITTSPKVISVSPASTTTYTVTAVSDANCTATAGDMTGSAVITVRPRPTSVISGTATICNGGSTNLSVDLTGTQPWSITYSDGVTPLTISGIAASTRVISVSPSSTNTYTVTEVSDANCTSIVADRTGSAVITVNVPSTAPASISGTTGVCNGSSTTLTATGGIAGTNCTYQWGTGAVVGLNIIPDQTLVSMTVTPVSAITYWVRRIDPSPCSTTTGGVTVTVTVFAPLAAGISGGSSVTCFNTSPGTFTTTASGGSGTFSYQWYTGAGVIAGATNSTYTPPAITINVDYNCVVTDLCGSVSTPISAVTIYGDLVPGLWTGCQSTLWQVGDNWADGNVPTNIVNVMIPSTAYRQPVINNTITGNCNDITIGSGASLTLTTGGTLNVTGNFNINSGPIGTLNNSGIVSVAGNFVNAGQSNLGSGEIILNGSTAQSISGTNNIGKLTFNKTAGDITNLGDITVNTQIKFVKGILNTSATTLLTLTGTATVFGATSDNCGATDLSYVNGPMVKTGNTDFIFPVGKSNSIYPVHPISFEVTDATVVTFLGEYFAAPPINPTFKESPIKKLSPGEYWNLNRLAGTNNVYVTLRWRNIYLPDPSVVVVAHYDAVTKVKWESKGNTATTGVNWTNSWGTVRSALVTSFSPFTYGLTVDDPAANGGWVPLPISLISFKANKVNNHSHLTWSTATEINNDFFTLERSTDALNFTEIVKVKGAGNSNKILDYSFDDDAISSPNTYYYRLKQTDFDGKFEYFNIVYLTFNSENNIEIKIYPNPVSDKLFINTNSEDATNVIIFNSSSQVVYKGSFNLNSVIDVNNLKSGDYYIQISNNVIMKKEKITIVR